MSLASLWNSIAQEYIEVEIKQFLLEDGSACSYENVQAWWARASTKIKYPHLSHVAYALFGFLPGSGSLECDIGGFSDIIGRRRGSLKPGMVEASMMLKLNKDLLEFDPSHVKEYSKTWKQMVPDRPEYPSEFFEEEGEAVAIDAVDVAQEETATGMSSDESDSS